MVDPNIALFELHTIINNTTRISENSKMLGVDLRLINQAINANPDCVDEEMVSRIHKINAVTAQYLDACTRWRKAILDLYGKTLVARNLN